MHLHRRIHLSRNRYLYLYPCIHIYIDTHDYSAIAMCTSTNAPYFQCACDLRRLCPLAAPAHVIFMHYIHTPVQVIFLHFRLRHPLTYSYIFDWVIPQHIHTPLSVIFIHYIHTPAHVIFIHFWSSYSPTYSYTCARDIHTYDIVYVIFIHIHFRLSHHPTHTRLPTHCNPLQPTATHCNPLQPTATTATHSCSICISLTHTSAAQTLFFFSTHGHTHTRTGTYGLMCTHTHI